MKTSSGADCSRHNSTAPFPMCVVLATSLALGPQAWGNGRFPRAERLIEHPNDPNQLVLGGTYGLLVTKDRGQNWHFVCEASFAHSSSYGGDSLLDFVGDGSLLASVERSINVSSDQACDWIPTLSEPDTTIIDHTVAKSNLSTVVAAVTLTHPGNSSNTLRESVDSGRTWTAFGSPLPIEILLSIDIDPNDPRRLYATGLNGNEGRFLNSVDHGTTWTSHPIPGTDSKAVPYLAAVLPTDSNKIFVRTSGPRQVVEIGDALLYSNDGGTTWQEIHRSYAQMLGFALSPDASRVLIGYGDTGPGFASLPGPLGVFESSTAQFSFNRIYGGPVNCISWTATGIYLCSNEALNGFELAFARDSDLHAVGGCFVPILHRNEVRGPLDCAPGTSGTKCDADWPTSCQTLDACPGDAGSHPAGCVPNMPSSIVTDAAEALEGGATVADSKDSGCACRTSRQRNDGGATFAFMTLIALGFHRTRRPRASALSRMLHSIARSSNS